MNSVNKCQELLLGLFTDVILKNILNLLISTCVKFVQMALHLINNVYINVINVVFIIS